MTERAREGVNGISYTLGGNHEADALKDDDMEPTNE